LSDRINSILAIALNHS